MKAQKEQTFTIPKIGETFVGEDGTVSQVLDDVVDESYEPTQEEIEDYAEWLGMKLPEDNMFLWMAREGLKAQLPKEWKPCRTNDNEIYYFNFKTGESTWKHPMDTTYQNRFQEAKKQQHADHTVSNDSNVSKGSGASQSNSQQKPPVWSQCAPMKSKNGANLAHSAPANTIKAASVEAPVGRQAHVATHAEKNLVEHNAVANTVLPVSGTFVSALLGSSSENEAVPASLPTPQLRIVSESEAALEESIRAQMKDSFEAETLKAQNLQKTTLEAMRKHHEDELHEMQAEEAKRYGGDADDGVEIGIEESIRVHNIKEVRAYLEKKYRGRLADLEKEVKYLDTQLKELTVESSRVKNLAAKNQLAAEREAAADKVAMLKAIDLEVKKYFEAKKKELDAIFQTKSDAIKENAKKSLDQARVMLDRSLRQKEAHVLAPIEMARKRLEMEKKQIEASIRNITNALSSLEAVSASATSENDQGTSAALEAIITKRDAACAELRAKALQEQEEVRREEAALHVRLRSHPSEETARPLFALPEGSTEGVEKLSNNSFTHFPDSSVKFAGGSTGYNAKLNALRTKYASEKEKSLANLAREREAKLRNVHIENSKPDQSTTPFVKPLLPKDVSAGCTNGCMPPTTTGAAPHVSPVEALRKQHAEEVLGLETCYASLEGHLAERFTKELESARGGGAQWQEGVAVQNAVETEIDLYAKQESILRGQRCERFESPEVGKLTTDVIATVDEEKRDTKCDPHQEQVPGDANGKTMVTHAEVSELEEKEKMVLAESAKLALERHRSQYLREERYAQEVIDAELKAYFEAEKAKILLKAANETAISANLSEDSLRLEKLLSERRDLVLSQQAELAQLRATVEEKRLKAKELKEFFSKEAEGETPNDSRVLNTLSFASTLKDAQEARMAAPRGSDHEQEVPFDKEFVQYSKRRDTVAYEDTPLSIIKTPQNTIGNRSMHYTQSHSQSMEPVTADRFAASPQTATPASDFQASDALRYWKRQKEYVAELYGGLERLRQEKCRAESCGPHKERLGSLSLSPPASRRLLPASGFHDSSLLRRAQSMEGPGSRPLQSLYSAELLAASVDGLNSRLSKLVSTLTGERHQPLRKTKPQLTSTRSDATKKKWDREFQEYLFSITEASSENF